MKTILIFLALVFSSISNSQVLYSNNFETELGGSIVQNTGTINTWFPGWVTIDSATLVDHPVFLGTKVAKCSFNNVADSFTLTFPSISLNSQRYRVKFKMLRPDDNSYCHDNLKVFFKATATGIATFLGIVNRYKFLDPIVVDAGWNDFYFDIPSSISGAGSIELLYSNPTSQSYSEGVFIDNLTVEQIPTTDIQMNSLRIDKYITTGTQVTGAVKNVGLNTITTATVYWKIDSGTTHSQVLQNLNLQANESIDFSINTQLGVTTIIGEHTITTWVSNINGTESNVQNNEIVKTFNFVTEIFPKTVVYEMRTGTWCGWCVRGHVGLKNMAYNHSKTEFIGISVHNGDPMVYSSYNGGMASYANGFPSGTIDRSFNADPGDVYLEASYQYALSRPMPIGKINITSQTWNPITRQISVDITSLFAVDKANANYKFAAIILENGVTGTANNYAQNNVYAANGTDIFDWEGINWRYMGSPIAATSMVYNHVGRALLGGFNGINGSMPAAIINNVSYIHTFSHVLPVTQNEANIEIVALLIDGASNKIINANLAPLNSTLSNTNFSQTSIKISPNPSNGLINIQTDKVVDLSLIDLTGKVVFEKEKVSNNDSINVSNLQKGIYVVKLKFEDLYIYQKLILN
jgi:Secretion system C-terminal sorting domain/Outer membrane protein Omp28